MKQMVIICGGIGSRLKKNYPKILVKIKKKTILEYQLELGKKYGYKNFLLLTGYKSKIIEDFLKKKKLLNNINIIKDKKISGTGGALLKAYNYLEKEFFLIYGDIFTNMNLEKMHFFFKKKNCEASLVINKNQNFHDSNLLTINKSKMINKFFFYPHKKIPQNCYSNEAIFMFKKKFFKDLKKSYLNKKLDLVKNILPILNIKKKIYAFKTKEFIIDCGTPERLNSLKNKFINRNIN